MSNYFIMRATAAPPQEIPAQLPLSKCKEGELNVLRLPDQRKAILIRTGEVLTAYLAVCPHMGGDLTLGGYCAKQQRITCCWHGYRFDAATGRFCENPNVETLKALRVKSEHFDPERELHYRLQPLDIMIRDGMVSVDYKDRA